MTDTTSPQNTDLSFWYTDHLVARRPQFQKTALEEFYLLGHNAA
jgi:hypothetical protein